MDEPVPGRLRPARRRGLTSPARSPYPDGPRGPQPALPRPKSRTSRRTGQRRESHTPEIPPGPSPAGKRSKATLRFTRWIEAKGDLTELLAQMQLCVEGLAEVTKVVSGFRFVTAGKVIDRDTADRELARFNDYVIEQKTDIAELKNSIRKLRADCEKVRALRNNLDALSETHSWGAMFGLFGDKARQRSLELAGYLGDFYADDQRMTDLFQQTLDLAQQAIGEVDAALGPPGIANPYNVPLAAEILRTYAVVFDKPESELHDLADVLSEARTALTIG